MSIIGYSKQIGNSRDNIKLELTTWDGKYPVLVITPKHPTTNQKQETIDFVLHELDDHDGYDEYLKLLGGE